jgi:hypothetical protein
VETFTFSTDAELDAKIRDSDEGGGGYYMLFVLNRWGVLSVARFLRLGWLP